MLLGVAWGATKWPLRPNPIFRSDAVNTPAWQAENPYASFGTTVADAAADERLGFVRRTYLHLAAAVYAVVMLEWVILSSGVMDSVMPMLMGRGAMLVMLIGFMGVSWYADRLAHTSSSRGVQYAALSIYVVAWAVMLAPMLYFAQGLKLEVGTLGDIGVIPASAIATLIMFGGLTAVAWFSGADFSFLRSALMLGGFAAVGLVVVSLIFGVHLGLWFSVAMIALASGYILYDTSKVMHHYQPSQYVAASLALFASVALLFWYILRLFMALSSRD